MKLVKPFDGYVEIDGEFKSLPEYKESGVGEGPVDVKVFKTVSSEIKQVDDNSVSSVISDGRVDRDNDTINPEGWDVSDYEKNPVVLWSHDQTIPPIAKSKIKVFKSKMTSLDTFAETEFAQSILGLVKGGFINAKSVGFMPTDFDFDEKRGGFSFHKQALLEHSYVSVPANPRALVVARSKGLNVAPVIEWAEKTLDEFSGDSIYVPKAVAESFYNSNSSTVTFDMGDAFTEEPTGGIWRDTTDSISWDAEMEPKTFRISFVEDEDEDSEEKDMEHDDEYLSFNTDEAKEYYDRIVALKEVRDDLINRGFSDEEVEEHIEKIAALELGEDSTEEEEKADDDVESKEVEEVLDIDIDALDETIKLAVAEARDRLTEVTGKVN